MNKEKNRFNVEEHTTLDGRIIDVFPISHRYIHNLEQQCKKQKEVIDKAIELTNDFAFKILTDNRIMYIRLKDLEQGKDLLDILKDKEV